MRWLLLAALLAVSAPALAVNPDEVLADPALEARARAISRELRCLVCQNQSIDDSNAELARDLRILVRERLKAGDSDEQVIEFLRSRYGDFVLLTPPLERATWVLWFGPPLVVLIGLGAVAVILRQRWRSATLPLDEEEKSRLSAILGEDER